MRKVLAEVFLNFFCKAATAFHQFNNGNVNDYTCNGRKDYNQAASCYSNISY